MILILLGGFAISETNAQANCKPADCKPCPPGCCIINCCIDKSAASADSNTDILFFTAMTQGLVAEEKVSGKTGKACNVPCRQSAKNATPVSIINTGASCLPVVSCTAPASSVAVADQKPNK